MPTTPTPLLPEWKQEDEPEEPEELELSAEDLIVTGGLSRNCLESFTVYVHLIQSSRQHVSSPPQLSSVSSCCFDHCFVACIPCHTYKY